MVIKSKGGRGIRTEWGKFRIPNYEFRIKNAI